MKGRSSCIALCVGALGSVLLMAPVSAQSPARTPKATTTPAATATGQVVQGEVTKVDAKKGWIDVKTPDGRMKLHFPPAALEGVKAGDGVSIEVALTPAGRE
jgi:hypothetical protein